MPRIAVVSAFRPLVETVVTTGWGGTVGISAAEVAAGSDATVSTDEVAAGPDIDTRLLRLRDLRAYEWKMGGRGLKARRRGGGAVLGARKNSKCVDDNT
jgi:hypothetical protein